MNIWKKASNFPVVTSIIMISVILATSPLYAGEQNSQTISWLC